MNLTARTFAPLPWLAGLALLAWAGVPWARSRRAAEAPVRPSPAEARPGLAPVRPDAASWAVFAPAPGPAPSPVASRYRLAGTFRLYATEGAETPALRQAVLDDLETRRQALVREGDQFGDLLVRAVGQDWVDVVWEGREERLMVQGIGDPGAPDRPGPAATAEDLPALERSAWGRRVAPDRWVFDRSAVMSYYQDLLDHPERLAGMVLTMQPEREEGEIVGFRYTGEAERAFFEAAGIRPGDVVRSVNSMRMITGRRAEYMIREFLTTGLDTLVFEVDRDGEPVRNIYFVRE